MSIRYFLLVFLPCIPAFCSAPAAFPPNSSDPDAVAADVFGLIDSHRRLLFSDPCLTGNPIDDCWLCSAADWRSDRRRLADCSIGFGRNALGGRSGALYLVTDSSDSDPANPLPGTLRHAAIQSVPLWIVFSGDMTIRLNEELLVNSFKTIDARGVNVHIAGGAGITLDHVSNVILHNLHVHDCVPAGNANVRSSPTHVSFRGRSDGDGISLYGSRDVWIDHCELSNCADGLIDATMASTAITISNCHFSRHNEVMLLGHDDAYTLDSGMQVTIAFNRFGEKLVQRMPRCRLGYFHIVNNDYTEWEMYAIGGSAEPTINSQGNRYIAPADLNAKEVTKRIDAEEGVWSGWNWRTDGDMLVNGAFFVPSGNGLAENYAKASSAEPKPAALVDQLTRNAGVLCFPGYVPISGFVLAGFSGTVTGRGSGTGGIVVNGNEGGGTGILGITFGGGPQLTPALFAMPFFVVCFFLFMSSQVL
ncbi:hypothetical protein HPP92_022300 [Vanilla planifolia]|uniref:Pectate lyase n=1 Tax=Vanilla planifolia TaxID=51239 RepID=A0A835UEZ3_VANPL|nr:hypothetical protein HPP92_022300 [Vanilla planifolia]